MTYKLELVRSGDGEHKLLGEHYQSLAECQDEIGALEFRFANWNWENILPDDDPLQYYEGCDVVATDEQTGKMLYLISDNEWEEL